MSSKKRKFNQNSLPHSAKRPVKIYQPIENIKHELTTYLQEHANISEHNDFWKFYGKFKVISSKSSNDERSKLLNIDFIKDCKALFNRLPVRYDDEWKPIEYSEFKTFLSSIKVYHDFQQKSNFNKLKKLKLAQCDLPIAKHKDTIMENVHTHKVLLIAGKIYNFNIFIVICCCLRSDEVLRVQVKIRTIKKFNLFQIQIFSSTALCSI